MSELEELNLKLAEFETKLADSEIKLIESEAKNKQLEIDKYILEEKVNYLTHKLYGKKSEKKREDNTPDLFNEAEYSVEKEEPKQEEETIEVKYTRKKGKNKRKNGWDKLPVKEIIVDIPEEEKTCACGEKMEQIGAETSEKLKVIPMQIEVQKYIRPKYACKCCQGVESEGVHPTVKIAPPKPSILPKSIFTPSLLAFILINKFCDALPFYRQEKIFDRIDVSLSRVSMCNATIKSYSRCNILEELLIKELKKSYYIGIDETTVQVLNEPDKPPESKSYMWVFRGGTKNNPIILFHYDPGRSGSVPKKYLEGYHGRIQSDGYAGYNLIGSQTNIIHYGCWAHARRKFSDAIEASKQKDGLSSEIISLIGQLYKIEDMIKWQEYSTVETMKYRKKNATPILKQIRDKIIENISSVPPQTKLGIALNYTLANWDKLERYTDDGIVPIDNNLVENAIRPFVVGRKNWLFYESQNGARASAFFYSLIETAKANGLEPFSYLNYIFEEIPYCKDEDDFRKLLPIFIDRTKIKNYKIPR